MTSFRPYFLLALIQKNHQSHSQVETKNRFRSLRSKPIDVEEKFHESENSRFLNIIESEPTLHSPRSQSLKDRELFHETFSFLIKLVRYKFWVKTA